MLSESMVSLLNAQINAEFYSSNVYLQMSAWCEDKALAGAAAFLRVHAAEELDHMHRIFDYVNEAGAMAVLGTIQAPPTSFESAEALFNAIYAHECSITARINEIVAAAMEEKDFATFNFLQWFVAEQREEEALTKSIVEKFAMVGGDGQGLFYIDRDLAQMAETPEATP
jgi:ferritin